MTVRVEVVTRYRPKGICMDIECFDDSEHPAHIKTTRKAFTEWPPEAIEAGVRAYFEYEDDTEWEQDVALAMADPAAVRFVRGLAAAWGHITGDTQ